MAVEITMPRLSDQMEEGTVLRWAKAEGDAVAKGDPIVEIETDKATWVVEAESSGELLRIVVGDGDTAPVGSTLAFIGSPGESAPEVAEEHGSAARPVSDVQDGTVPASGGPAPSAAAGRARATPSARSAAAELGVELESVVGTGPDGRIVRGDVLAAATVSSAGSPGRGAGTRLELTPTQRTIARRMLESTTTIPHFALQAEIDMEAAVALRAELKEESPGAAPSINDLVLKAVALALREFPMLNASHEGDSIVRWQRVNVGIAVALDDALLVPVVVDADEKPLAQLAQETRDLIARAQARTLTPAELSDGTFTVSNLGMLGVRSFSAVINPPQAAILAVGEISPRACVDETGAIVARQRLDATLSCDHRIVYGAEGAGFLARARELLEQPRALTI